MNPTRNHEVVGSTRVLLSGLRIQRCHGLWCRSQTQLGSCVAVAVVSAGGFSSDSTPAWELPHATNAALKKQQQQQQKTKKKKRISSNIVVMITTPPPSPIIMIIIDLSLLLICSRSRVKSLKYFKCKGPCFCPFRQL